MTKLENPVGQKLIDRVIKKLQDINYNRKNHEVKELSIGEIIAPLYYYLGDEKRCTSFKNLLDDLEMYPDYSIGTLDYEILTEEDLGVFDLRIELYRFNYLDDRITSQKAAHHYEIHFYNMGHVISTGDIVRRWTFRLEKITEIEIGCWEPETLDSTANCTYDKFVKNVDDCCKQTKEVDDDKTRKSNSSRIN